MTQRKTSGGMDFLNELAFKALLAAALWEVGARTRGGEAGTGANGAAGASAVV